MNLTSLIQRFSQYSFSSQSDKTLSTQSTQSALQSLQVSQAQSPEEQHQSALQVVNDTLAKAYEHIRSNKLSATDQYQAVEPLTAEKVANNILGFIERRLKADQAEGATQEELSSRLEAGLSGFKRGFAEAQEKLKALDLLSDTVSADIGKTYDLVLKGVDELGKKFLGEAKAPAEATSDESASSVAATEPAVVNKLATQLSGFNQLGQASARDFSFVLKTQEGDRVQINASAFQSLGVASDANGFALSASSSNSLSFSVKGDLNEEELAAINDLLGKVNVLADQFYAGDLEQAWASATSLGFDDSQIAGYALRLVQVDAQVVQSTPTTEAAVPAVTPDSRTLDIQSALAQLPGIDALGEFMASLLDSLAKASLFSDSGQLLEDIASGVDPADSSEELASSISTEPKPAETQAKTGFQAFLHARIYDLQLLQA